MNKRAGKAFTVAESPLQGKVVEGKLCSFTLRELCG